MSYQPSPNSTPMCKLITEDIFEKANWVFSYFEFKINLIRQSLSFQKQKFLFSNSQPTDSQLLH